MKKLFLLLLIQWGNYVMAGYYYLDKDNLPRKGQSFGSSYIFTEKVNDDHRIPFKVINVWQIGFFDKSYCDVACVILQKKIDSDDRLKEDGLSGRSFAYDILEEVSCDFYLTDKREKLFIKNFYDKVDKSESPAFYKVIDFLEPGISELLSCKLDKIPNLFVVVPNVHSLSTMNFCDKDLLISDLNDGADILLYMAAIEKIPDHCRPKSVYFELPWRRLDSDALYAYKCRIKEKIKDAEDYIKAHFQIFFE